jgi:hypothetical protein
MIRMDKRDTHGMNDTHERNERGLARSVSTSGAKRESATSGERAPRACRSRLRRTTGSIGRIPGGTGARAKVVSLASGRCPLCNRRPCSRRGGPARPRVVGDREGVWRG